MIRSKNRRADLACQIVTQILKSDKFHVELNEHKEYFEGSTIDGPTLSYEIQRLQLENGFYIQLTLGSTTRVHKKRYISLNRNLNLHGHIKDITESLFGAVFDVLIFEDPKLYFDSDKGNKIAETATGIAMMFFDETFDSRFDLAISSGLFHLIRFMESAKGNDREGSYLMALDKLVSLKTIGAQ